MNPRLVTGEIEVHADKLSIFNRSETPPFLIEDKIDTAEEKRLHYRYLDLRRPALQQTLIKRSQMNAVTRQTLNRLGFLELETPYLVKYTPGGARNFLVPARLNPGKFYALAESPQLFKQLFMVAGFERYFQIVKCFRDEDLRLDRQPEFTQIDLEMSFVTQDDVFTAVEELITALWREVLGVEIPRPFPRMKYEQSMREYGNDKPDLRFGLQHVELTGLIVEHGGGGVPIWQPFANVTPGQIVKALKVPASANFSRTEVDKLEEIAKGMGARGLARAKVGENGEWTQSPLAKSITPEARAAINAAAGARPGDLLLFQFGKESMVHTVLANLRLYLGKRLGLIPESSTTRTTSAGSPPTTPSPGRTTNPSSPSRRIRAGSSATATTWCSTASRSRAAPSACTIPRSRRGCSRPWESRPKRRSRSSASSSRRCASALRRTAGSRWGWTGSPSCSPGPNPCAT